MPAAEAGQIPAVGWSLHPGLRPDVGAGHARSDVERGPDGRTGRARKQQRHRRPPEVRRCLPCRRAGHRPRRQSAFPRPRTRRRRHLPDPVAARLRAKRARRPDRGLRLRQPHAVRAAVRLAPGKHGRRAGAVRRRPAGRCFALGLDRRRSSLVRALRLWRDGYRQAGALRPALPALCCRHPHCRHRRRLRGAGGGRAAERADLRRALVAGRRAGRGRAEPRHRRPALRDRGAHRHLRGTRRHAGFRAAPHRRRRRRAAGAHRRRQPRARARRASAS